MTAPDITLFGDFAEPEEVDFEGALTFDIKATYIERRAIWKNKDITAEFLGNFWENLLDGEDIKSTLYFVCAELLENAVSHSVTSNYMVKIQLCFAEDELLVYVGNTSDTGNIEAFKEFIRALLETRDLRKLFVERMKDAKKLKCKASRLGLITLLKDRGAKLAWKLEQFQNVTDVTTLARIAIKGKER